MQIPAPGGPARDRTAPLRTVLHQPPVCGAGLAGAGDDQDRRGLSAQGDAASCARVNRPADPNMEDTLYTTRLEEGLLGGLLVAVTLAMHGFGMLLTLRASNALKERFQRHPSFAVGMGIIILASWMIIVVHMVEVTVWAHFFYWKDAVNSSKNTISLCYYFALMDYTTLGSNYNLKLHWRLLEGMIAIAGLMTFAWSTGVLLTLAQEFQDQQMALLKQKREKRHAQRSPAAAHPPPDPKTS